MPKHKTYVRDFYGNKKDCVDIIAWCRENFGDDRRGTDWDFYLVDHKLCIDIMDDKFKVMYELWHG